MICKVYNSCDIDVIERHGGTVGYGDMGIHATRAREHITVQEFKIAGAAVEGDVRMSPLCIERHITRIEYGLSVGEAGPK